MKNTCFMKYGITIPNFGEYFNPRTVVDLAREAEKAGWDGFFLWDHMLFRKDSHVPINDPWIVLAAIAANTKRISFGTTVTPVPRRRPWKLARETVSLDHLSIGRLILGVGLGFPPDVEYGFFGEEPDVKLRAKKLDEGLDILSGLWSGKPFSYKGEHFKLKQMVFLPPPVQSPRIPIWVAGMWPHRSPFRRAAKWDGVIPICVDFSREITPEILQEILNYIKQYRTSNGHFDVVIFGETPSDDLDKGAEKISSLIKVGMTWWLEMITGQRGSFEEMRERIKQGPLKGTSMEA